MSSLFWLRKDVKVKMKYLVILLIAVVVILLSTFGIQNPNPVTVRFLQWQSDAVPIYAVMLVSVLLGMLINTLIGLPGRIQRQLELRRLRHSQPRRRRKSPI
jgi:uncharacterized integral membrane protein